MRKPAPKAADSQSDNEPSEETPGALSFPEDLPGAAPVGSVTLTCIDGDLLTVPVAAGHAIHDFLNGRQVAAARVEEGFINLVTWRDGQMSRFDL